MKPTKIWIIILFLLSGFIAKGNSVEENKIKEVDICIYGGTSAGVIAAYTAKMSGKRVILIEPELRLGGLSSGGLGFTDIGNKYVVTGLAHDFYRRIGAHYGKLEQWIFEPKVAAKIFDDYIKEAKVEVWMNRRLVNVKKTRNIIDEITVEDSKTPLSVTNKIVKAKVFIDCSYEGDLMAKAGVSYTIGREANSVYNETFNGVQMLDKHQFPDGIDPYIVPRDKNSGLLWGINDDPIASNGTGDKKVQAYNFRVTLTNRKDNMLPITKPDNYDPNRYELLLRLKEKQPWKIFNDIFIWSMMPNGKTDINNYGAFSTDLIGKNWNYPDASYDERAKIFKEHEDYTKGLLYFVGHDSRIPEFVQNQMLQWGYPKDEYVENNHWTPQLYVREVRRMIGETVMTQHHCQGKVICDDTIGWAAYTMDSHNCNRIVVNGMVKNEGDVQVGGFDPYPISYKAITPKQQEVGNLLVPVCLSASHIAYGSIRMEPVFMVLAQSSSIAASLAIDNKSTVQKVDAVNIQNILKSNPLASKSIPEVLVDNDNVPQVTITGDWKTEKWKAYGHNFLSDDSKGKVFKSVKYTPEIDKEGKYHVYAYFPKETNASTQTQIIISDGKKQSERIVKNSKIVVEGQTSGEWVPIGEYHFRKGSTGYVEITNKNANGVIVADAVLFIPDRTNNAIQE